MNLTNESFASPGISSSYRIGRLCFIIFLIATIASCRTSPEPGWYKGNLHTHSFWSDGDDFPESILSWYENHDYDFVAISDHNTISDSQRWIKFDTSSSRFSAYLAYLAYRNRFGSDWVESTEVDDSVHVRLKTYEEYAGRFNRADSFLVIRSEEISDGFEGKPIHVNATNLERFIEPQGGTSVLDVMQRNVNAVLKQREETGAAMFPHINHPNFGWAVSADDLAHLEGEQFIEVYNGHPLVNNNGDDSRPGIEAMWDYANTIRRTTGMPLLYGIGVDDAHNYHEMASNRSNPGRGWIMVQASSLTAEALISSMEAGDFYASSGVTLARVDHDSRHISIDIVPQDGVTFKTVFMGTRRGANPEEPLLIGVVLEEVEGVKAEYEFRGDELFVRARIVSSTLKTNPYSEGEYERAWTQPIIVAPED